MATDNQVQVIDMPEIHLIGFSITLPFKGQTAEKVNEMKQQFFRRKGEIPNMLQHERYMSPHFASEVLFTYMICMEVAELSIVPEGMIGFTIPAHTYAKVRSNKDPYKIIHKYLKQNNKKNNNNALALEIYPFENPVWPDETDVLVPILVE